MARGLVEYEYKIELFTNEEALNKLGREGWDLVCPGGKDGNYLVFKRAVGTAGGVGHDGDDDGAAAKAKKKSYKDFL